MVSQTLTIGRRTQTERTQEMRARLMDATVRCLDKYGYAGTTISVIVAEAGVSRGAHLHHFESKSALILASSENLMRAIFRRLGDAVPRGDNTEDRLATLVRALWENVFLSRDGKVLLELFIAARTDRDLAKKLRVLALRTKEMYAAAARHYFKAKPNAGMPVEDIVFLTQWQLRGMLLDTPISNNPKLFRQYLDQWVMILSRFVTPRDNVTGPPPRPGWWDET
ncbi:MAG: TetR/AcrR family transcriptional regulator [Pseudomonadota bacterium]